MKLLKNIVLCLFIAVSAVGVTSTAYAADGGEAGRIIYKPAEAINLVLEKIKAAQDAIAANKDPKDVKDVLEAIKAAKDASKEINANDKVDIARIRANGHLAKAIGMVKEQDLKAASEHLDTAATAFAELKKLL
jgi:hypothetical protein